jgi:RNA polymerase sigma-70 factor, ECF subfamily
MSAAADRRVGKAVGAARGAAPDAESYAWVKALRSDGATHDEAVHRLRRLLFRSTRYQLARRAGGPQLRGEEFEDVAGEAADDALVAVLTHLDEFRGGSSFTTWACRIAIVEASLAVRKRRWKGRELPVDEESWPVSVGSGAPPDEEIEQLELLHAVRDAVDRVLTDWQRDVFVAVALNDVPIREVAARSGRTPGAVYKALHDARRKLRVCLEAGVAGPVHRPPPTER